MTTVGELQSLVNADGGSMFACYSGDGDSDDFDADQGLDDSDELYTDAAVKQPAHGLYGSHDCIFGKTPKGFKDTNVKMVITEEANANYRNSVNGEIKAQLFAYNQGNGILKESLQLSCSKSGELISIDVRQ